MDVVDGEFDGVGDTMGFDDRPPLLAIERERHCKDGLQRIALSPSGRGDVGLAG